MKVAICMWGASRWAEKGSKKFEELLVNPLLESGHVVKVYKHCPVSKHLNAHNQGLSWFSHNQFKPEIFSIDDQDGFLMSLKTVEYTNCGNPWPERPYGFQTLEMLLVSLWSMSKLWSLIEHDDWKPDIIIGYRPDTILCEAFDSNYFSLLDSKKSQILLPDFSKCPINDRFFVCNNYNIAKIYLCRFNKAKSYSQNKTLHSEKFLHFILTSENIETIDIPVKLMRLRANKSIFNLDVHLETRHVFIVTSVIKPSKEPINFFSTRSKFTPNERLKQTRNTIKSIRHHFLNSYIILVEGSDADVSSIENVDQVVFCKDPCISSSPNRSLGDIYLTRAGILGYQQSETKKTKKEKFYKMSGRYHLTDCFDMDAWTGEGAAFAYYNEEILKKHKVERCYTFFYKAWEPDQWLRALDQAEARLGNKSLDSVLPFVDYHSKIKYTGVTGLISSSGLEFTEFNWYHYISFNFPGKKEGGRGNSELDLDLLNVQTPKSSFEQWERNQGSKNHRKYNSNKPLIVHVSDSDTKKIEYVFRLSKENHKYVHVLCTTQDFLRELDSSCVYLHIHSLRNVPLKAIDDFIKKNKMPYLITIHDTDWEQLYTVKDGRVFQFQDLQNLFLYAKKILLPSEFLYSRYEVLASLPNITVVPNIDYWVSSTLHWTGVPNNGKLTAGFLGAFLESKGSKDFCDLAGILSQDLDFITLAAESTPNIKNILLRQGDDCISILRENINIVVFPGSWSSWGFKFGEALASGLPVVYQNIGAFRERSTNYPWHFPYKRPQELEQTVKKAVNFLLKQKQSKGQFIEKHVPSLYKNVYS